MNERTRRRLAWFFLLLLVAMLAFSIKWFLFPMFTPSSPSPNSQQTTIFGVALLTVMGAMVLLLKPRNRTTTAHGSAHFATDEELKTYGPLVVHPRKEQQAVSRTLTTGSLPPSKMQLGLYRKKLIVLDERTQESHVFLLAPSGVGKTSRVIVPALLREFGSRSLFINDTKGELVELTVGHLSLYHRCLVFAPTTPHTSHRYNPLAHVHNMDDAEALASCLIDNTGTSREEFWNSAPKLLVAATVLHLHETEPSAPFSRLIDILCGRKLEDIQTMFQQSRSSIAKDVATSFFENLQKNERLAGSIMVEMATRFFRFKNPAIREVTRSNDLDFTRMIAEPTALFLSVPEDEAQRLEPLSACLIMQLMSSMVRRATRNPGRRLERDMVLYLDEFCNAGIIPKFTKYISTVRSRGIAFVLAVQDFGQLRATYGENGRDTILANCNTHIVFPGCGLQETRYYSEKLGRTTVETISHSQQESLSFVSNPQTWAHGETHRFLMTPDELRTMRDGILLVLISKLHPMLVHNTPYYHDPELLAEVNIPVSSPASRVTVTPIAPEPPPPTMGLPAPQSAARPQPGSTGPEPKTPAGPSQSTNQNNEEFFSPE
jgi:type IV secretion system protein VirD4